MIFLKYYCYKAYEVEIFSNFEITGFRVVFGCSDLRVKMGPFLGVSVRGSVSFRLAGGTVPERNCFVMIIL
jgi:hypothetical protein